jgi:outer membrane lipoprotein
MRRTWSAALALLAAAACAKPPPLLQGTVVEIGVRQAQQQDMNGTRVRWGGRIVSTTPQADVTCVEILGLPLDRRARPLDVDTSEGRFMACAPGFYDPEVFAPKREVTVTGALGGRVAGKVGELDYQFPKVEADVVYLWPERVQAVAYPAYPYGWGWYGGWGYPYWGGFGYPYRRYPYRGRVYRGRR